ncbi:hypothetical protein SEUCBS140593_009706 [Sporothrix eucalyptigena]|uniref:Uncharacterized protein n=1 Tax=Sporothrix eucalyptigena TaxID=1812306 RepID=A0ABP0CXP2_9PEZI
MGELLFALSGKPQTSWSNNSHIDSTTSTEFKPNIISREDDFAKPRTTDIQDTLMSSELATHIEQDMLEGKDEDDTNNKVHTASPQPQIRIEPQIAPTPLASTICSPLLRLPLEIRLQIYRWVMLLGITDRSSGMSTPNKAGGGSSSSGSGSSSSSSKTKTGTDSTVSVSSTLFHCMPPYFFDSPQHFGPGDGIMFMDLFSAKAHQTPLEFRQITMKEEKPAEGEEDEQDREPPEDVQLLAAFRPIGRALPVGLLASCRQIYGEARLLAFEISEFVFVRLFSSALSTAHAFIVIGSHTFPGTVGGDPPRLRHWQRDHIRHMRLELDVSVADMAWRGPERDPKYLEDGCKPGPKIVDETKWLALCGALSKGLHGLRILLNVTEEKHQATVDGVDDESGYEENGSEKAVEAVAQSVLVQGFCRLAALRQLEIELVWVLRGRFRSRAANMTSAATRASLAWCASVEKAINKERQKQCPEPASSASHRPVWAKVVCVERIYDEEKKKI